MSCCVWMECEERVLLVVCAEARPCPGACVGPGTCCPPVCFWSLGPSCQDPDGAKQGHCCCKVCRMHGCCHTCSPDLQCCSGPVGPCCSEGSGATPTHITSGMRPFVSNSFMWTKSSAGRRSWDWKEKCVCVCVCVCCVCGHAASMHWGVCCFSCDRKQLHRLMHSCCTKQHLQCTARQSRPSQVGQLVGWALGRG